MIRKVFVANRAAIARRVVRACNALGLESVAVYSDADKGAPHLAEAGSAEPLPGVRPEDTYLNQDALIEIMQRTGCDAVHPGYGFLAENAGFARRCLEAGVRFVGPHPDHLDQLGDKVEARKKFSDTGFPMHAGSALVADVKAAMRAADAIGYPVLLKPSLGGGGIGMIRAEGAAELAAAFGRAQAVAQSAFASADVYIEKWVANARHIEFQILADGRGGAMHLFERDCSVQRRHQKVIEEAPAVGIDRDRLNSVAGASAQALAGLGYASVGTVETLADRDHSFGFLEVNPRIQVEHAVTEAVTGVDLVATQLQLADGGELPDPAELTGHAIELRLYAEHPQTYAPSTGRLSRFRAPKMYGVRVETGYTEGMFVTPFYDPLLAKIITHADNRELAIGRALVALQAFEVAGVETNSALLRRVLQSEAFLSGLVHTRFLDELT